MNAPAAIKPAKVTISIWSDVMCPWCVIGYKQLAQALKALEGEIEAEVRWHPFELNPDLPPEGEDLASHFVRKFGRTLDEHSPAKQQMQVLAEQAGYSLEYQGGGDPPEQRLWNTFLAHKLLRWAYRAQGGEVQTRLKLALFDAHFQQRRNVSNRGVLLDIAERVGLDRDGATAALEDERIGQEVRDEESLARQMEINAVPTMLVNRKYLIPGAQHGDGYVRLLRKVVEKEAEAVT